MTRIHSLRWRFSDPAYRTFVAERLAGLKTALSAEISGTGERNLRLATWNLMHFGDGGGYRRTLESMLYIAEIIDHFDLVAVQEVNRDLTALESLMNDHLGPEWDYLVTDTTGGRPGEHGPGNNERLAFLYRRAKVSFCKETGEIVLPEGQEIAAPEGDSRPTRPVQFARTPFSVAFRCGWLKFKLCTVHIFYGKDSEGSPEMAQRRAEIAKIAGFLAQRQEDERDALVDDAKAQGWAKPSDAARDANYILLGDFNIVSPEHDTMKALEDNGFTIPDALKSTQLPRDHYYDQIAVKGANPGFQVLKAGVFDMLAHVYRDDDADFYINQVKPAKMAFDSHGTPRPHDAQADYFKRYYRVNQMSDHKLLWCEIATDYAHAYLEEIAGKPLPAG